MAMAQGIKKILIVEDEKFLRELMATKLEKENFGVVTAVDGIEAIKKTETEKPDLILLDIILPGKDGFEVLRAIRAMTDKTVAQTPIIMLTNLGQESDREKAVQLGANDYLVKAFFTTDEIVQKMNEFLSK